MINGNHREGSEWEEYAKNSYCFNMFTEPEMLLR